MGREIRKVPADWKHPKNKKGYYIPLFSGSFKQRLAEWNEGNAQWQKGFRLSWDKKPKWIPKEKDELNFTYEEWSGNKPVKSEYMPDWSKKEKTHIQLYETTSEGTPLTPVFSINEFEKLCEYAAKKCYTFADCKATKEQWMKMLSDDFVHVTIGNVTFI